MILNADGAPLSTWPLSFVTPEEAIKTLYRDRAIVLEEWPDVFRSPSVEVRIPKILMLRNYAPVHAKPKFCRRSVFLRDGFACQYCGNKFDSEELTFDHVVPRSLGGQTIWENIVTACVACNSAKQNQAPNMSAKKGAKGGYLRPLKPPRQPSTAELLRAGLKLLDPETKQNFGDWLYWDTELEK
ncbi:MAG: HNH endonuclease [Pseudomonadota bacterium]|nr:HNH endonuclease [Pseudomonadota bacterium]